MLILIWFKINFLKKIPFLVLTPSTSLSWTSHTIFQIWLLTTTTCYCWEEKLYLPGREYPKLCRKFLKAREISQDDIPLVFFFFLNLFGLNVESFCNINGEQHSATGCLSRGRGGYTVWMPLITVFFISPIYLSLQKSQLVMSFSYNSVELKNKRQSCFIDHIYSHTKKHSF